MEGQEDTASRDKYLRCADGALLPALVGPEPKQRGGGEGDGRRQSAAQTAVMGTATEEEEELGKMPEPIKGSEEGDGCVVGDEIN